MKITCCATTETPVQERQLSRQEGGNICSRTCSWLAKSCTRPRVCTLVAGLAVIALAVTAVSRLWHAPQPVIEPSFDCPPLPPNTKLNLRHICYPTSLGEVVCAPIYVLGQ